MKLFEEARWDFITEYGHGLKEFHEKKAGPVILETTIKFKRELPNREKIRIESSVISLKDKIMQLEQVIYKEDESVSSTAIFTIGFMDLKLRKLVSFPDYWLHAVGAK